MSRLKTTYDKLDDDMCVIADDKKESSNRVRYYG